MWTLEKIKELRSHAYKTFGIEIPLSTEIEKIQLFLEQSSSEIKHNLPRIIKTVSFSVRWLPNFWNHPMEVDFPEVGITAFRNAMIDVLNDYCDKLAGLSGYNKED